MRCLSIMVDGSQQHMCDLQLGHGGAHRKENDCTVEEITAGGHQTFRKGVYVVTWLVTEKAPLDPKR